MPRSKNVDAIKVFPRTRVKEGKALRKARRKSRALNVARLATQGKHRRATKKVRSSIHFRRPHTVILKRKPKYARKSAPARARLHEFKVLRHPLTTESAMQKIEDTNTLVFITDPRANKRHIKAAVEKMYNIKTAKVNTLIRPDGQKKAYVKLQPDFDALDVASQIGII